MPEIKKCRICDNKIFSEILNLGNQYYSGRFPSKGQKIPKAKLNLIKCNKCDLVQLKNKFKSSEMYGDFYGYESSQNVWMINHLKKNVNELKKFLKNKDIILDIGSNDGTTLSLFPKNNFKYGFDPSAKKFKKNYPKNSKLILDFFSYSKIKKLKLRKKFKLITSFAMFYDLDDPIKFAKDIERIIENDGVWCLEQSYLPEMLEKNAFDTICHEHLEYYSLKQIELIMSKANLRVFDVKLNGANGGSFNIKVCKKNSNINTKKSVLRLRIFEKNYFSKKNVFSKFKKRILKIKLKLLAKLKKYKNSGKSIYALGASTKGNILLQYYNLDNSIISAVGEVNKKKFGKYTPGTNIKIVDENILVKKLDSIYLIMPWHFKSFFLKSKKLKNKIKIFPLPEVYVAKK